MENEVREPVPMYSYISPEEYLAMELSSNEKYEYYRGEIFAMSGASLSHNDIFHNVYGALVPFLKGKSCKPYGSNLRIHIPENTLYAYPDISIVCNKPETADKISDSVINPVVIIEILSKTTKDYDRGTKFTLYRSIKTLKQYVLIDSTAISVEIFTKQTDNSWVLTEFKQLTDSFVITPVNLSLSLQDIYEDVHWDE